MNADEGFVKVRFANIYKFPVVEGNVITSVVRGTRLHVLTEEGEFFKIEFYNQVAYIPKSCIATSA